MSHNFEHFTTSRKRKYKYSVNILCLYDYFSTELQKRKIEMKNNKLLLGI